MDSWRGAKVPVLPGSGPAPWLHDTATGELVPADARVLSAVAVEVDESSLTGESLPVTKHPDPTPGRPLAERTCMVYEGSTVLSGVCRAVVVAVGDATAAGRAMALAPRRRDEVGLHAQLAAVTAKVLPWTLTGGAGVVLTALLRGSGIKEAVTSGVYCAVAAVPEGLPLVATGSLACRPDAGDRVVDCLRGHEGVEHHAVVDRVGHRFGGFRVQLDAERLLREGGRLAVVSFHSLEDRIVKSFFAERAGRTPAGSRHRPPEQAARRPTFQLLFNGAKSPDVGEIDANPRARSAKLRAAVRTAAPAWRAAA